MPAIFIVLLVAALAAGIAVGVLLAVIHHQAAEARQHADQAKLAEVEELYAAWAALRARTRRPPV